MVWKKNLNDFETNQNTVIEEKFIKKWIEKTESESNVRSLVRLKSGRPCFILVGPLDGAFSKLVIIQSDLIK